jgi:phosphatidylglycerophosphate synthase
VLHDVLAFKAYEIEELADVYFFRPLGAVTAHAAQSLGLTPNQLTVAGAAVGMMAGALLYDERLGLVAFALLIVHGIVDSSDGQLARMTGQTSELGRILDGIGGYATHVAIYVAILAGYVSRGGSVSMLGWATLAGVANTAQAQLYEYHRTSYTSIVLKGRAPQGTAARVDVVWVRRLFRGYLRLQHRLIGLHGRVESAIAARSPAGIVSEHDRSRYRATFYGPVRGWNLLGDNTRFYAIGVLAWLHHLEWFFAFILLPMNVALGVLWYWQRRADRRFLALC